ncbi:MAG TPA: methylated-DNA--[protein]-cysteine S-methyltransferase [Solirubrobacteraceae bacterium]|jgi:methylated-DNA-[protein]-cysteine S-methyltransferase|nr:methylated-DNA--[protein]-cysteine S-methyltransferase [Solirubrobacteraceae bacterium]
MTITTPPPTEARARLALASPIGTLVLEGNDDALTDLVLPGCAGSHDTAPAGFDLESAPRAVAEAARQLSEYFDGERTAFELALQAAGTPFQREVWTRLAEIPYGETISYAELAASVERPQAFRAVGSANGANPIAIVVPCHRVITSSGNLGGYAGGLDAKRTLLALEGVSL